MAIQSSGEALGAGQKIQRLGQNDCCSLQGNRRLKTPQSRRIPVFKQKTVPYCSSNISCLHMLMLTKSYKSIQISGNLPIYERASSFLTNPSSPQFYAALSQRQGQCAIPSGVQIVLTAERRASPAPLAQLHSHPRLDDMRLGTLQAHSDHHIGIRCTDPIGISQVLG